MSYYSTSPIVERLYVFSFDKLETCTLDDLLIPSLED